MYLLIAQTLLLVLLLILAAFVVYLVLLTLAAWLAPRRTPVEQPAGPLQYVAILVPAHNEETTLAECLESLARLDYPADAYTTLVIADNCSDGTAEIARDHRVQVTERHNPDLRGKGYALEWGLDYLRQSGSSYDAILILDADTNISPNFLRVMSARLARGERVIQPYYSVRNPSRSWAEALRYIALTVLHYVRPQGRMVLGGSAGLKGNGMLFAADILQRHHWSASLTEDIEFHMELLLDGERVSFAPDATVWGEMPGSLARSRTQIDRWEQGRLEMIRRYVPRLAKASIQALRHGQLRRAYLLFDAIMEHLIPPFSILSGLTASGWIAALIFASAASLPGQGRQPGLAGLLPPINLTLASLLCAGQIFYLLSGLKLANAPIGVYRSLIYTPFFIVWKLGQYLRVLLRRSQSEWVRTARNGGE